MSSKRMLGSEIALLRHTLKMSEAEFSSQIGLAERQVLKLLESGKKVPAPSVKRALFKLLSRSSGRFTALKKLRQTIDERAQQGW